jgi:hypothetical protein
MINPYEAPQADLSKKISDFAIPARSDNAAPSKVLIVGLSLIALIAPCCLCYVSMYGLYALYFDPSLIPKNAGPGYLGNYITLPLSVYWIVAQLRFLFSGGKDAGKGLAIFHGIFAGMMLMALLEGLASLLGLTEPSPDSPPPAENSLGWFFLIFTVLFLYFASLSYTYWRVTKINKRIAAPGD